jgi:hypothetical protein
VHLDYIIGAALFIIVVASVAVTTFQSLTPFYMTAKADQLSAVSDNISQALLSGFGNPQDWGNQLSLPDDFQLGLAEYDSIEYPNTGGVGLYSLDPNKLSRLSSYNPYFIPYSSFASGFSDEILDLDSSFYGLDMSQQNALYSLGLSNYRFSLVTRPPYQLVVTVERSPFVVYPFETSFLLRVESMTWDNISIPGVQYSFVLLNPRGSVTEFLSGGTPYSVFSGVTDASGEATVTVKIRFNPKNPQGRYIITTVSQTSDGLKSFSFTPLDVFVIDQTYKVFSYTWRPSAYTTQVVAHIWNSSDTPAVLIDPDLQSKQRISIKATVFQPNGSVIGPADMSYDPGGFWTYNYASPLDGQYLCVVSARSVNMTIYDHIAALVEKIERLESANPGSVSWTAAAMWMNYYYTGEFLSNATLQISKGDNKQLNPDAQWWKWSYDYLSLCTYAYSLAYWATDSVHDDWLWNATNYGANTLVDDYSKWANNTIADNAFPILALTMLYIATDSSNSTYLDLATKASAWIEDNWQTGPYQSSEPTYDVGAATWALMSMFQATGDTSYYNLAQDMAYWIAARQESDGKWPGSSEGGGAADYTALPLIGICSTWNYTFLDNVTAGLDWFITTECEGTGKAYKLAAAVIASAYCNAYTIPPFGIDFAPYPMMADYGISDIPYKDTVALTRYITIRGDVYQAILHFWDPIAETSTKVLTASCIGFGLITGSPMVLVFSRRLLKKRGKQKE